MIVQYPIPSPRLSTPLEHLKPRISAPDVWETIFVRLFVQNLAGKEDWLLVREVGNVAHDLPNLRAPKSRLDLLRVVPVHDRTECVQRLGSICSRLEFRYGPRLDAVLTPSLLDQGHVLGDVVLDVVLGIVVVGEYDGDCDGHCDCWRLFMNESCL